MKRNGRIVAALAFFSLVAFAALRMSPSASGAEKAKKAPAADAKAAGGGAFKPVAPLGIVMQGVDGHYQALVKGLSTEKPKTLKKEALLAAELINVARLAQPQKDFTDWAATARDSLVKLSAEIGKADAKALKTATAGIEGTCKACHDKYKEE